MKAKTINAWNGFAKIALLSKNRLTQQKMIGVISQHLYGRSSSGSLTLNTISPTTGAK